MEKSVAESTGGATGGMSYAGAIQGTVKPDSKPIFLKEVDYFGSIKPTKEQWLSNEELYKSTSRQRSGKGAIRKRLPLQKPRWEKTKLTIRYLYHENIS